MNTLPKSNRRVIIGGPSQFQLQVQGLDRRQGVDRSLRFDFAFDPECHRDCADKFVLSSLGIPNPDEVILTDRETWMIEMESRTDGSKWRGTYTTQERKGWIELVTQ